MTTAKIDQSKPMTVALKITDTANNVIFCDFNDWISSVPEFGASPVLLAAALIVPVLLFARMKVKRAAPA